MQSFGAVAAVSVPSAVAACVPECSEVLYLCVPHIWLLSMAETSSGGTCALLCAV